MAIEEWRWIDKTAVLMLKEVFEALKEVLNRILSRIALDDVGLAIPRSADKIGLPRRCCPPPRS